MGGLTRGSAGALVMLVVGVVGSSACSVLSGLSEYERVSGERDGGNASGTGGGNQGGGGQGGGGGGTPAACDNGMQNGAETDVDCGGGECAGCALGRMCAGDTDCMSGACSSAGVCAAKVLISEVRSRGANGSGDEFVELYNPGDEDVTLDDTWVLQTRDASWQGGGACEDQQYVTRWTGAGEVIPSHGHLLIVSSGYGQAPLGDVTYPVGPEGFRDAASIRLNRDNDVSDAICFGYDAATMMALTTCSVAYTCEGMPATNPHDDTLGTAEDASLERAPGGAEGNMTDTGDSSADFAAASPADPQNLMSPPAP